MGRDQVEEEAGECVSRKDQKDLETVVQLRGIQQKLNPLRIGVSKQVNFDLLKIYDTLHLEPIVLY